MTGYPAMPQGDPAEQAIYWLTLLTSGEIDEQQQRNFKNWLNDKPAHQTAWDNAQSLWQGVAQLTEQDVAELTPVKAKVIPLQTQRSQFSYASLGLVACLVLSLSLWMIDLPYYLADYQTRVGEGQEVTLADGSVIQLNTQSAISVDYSDSVRQITLHRGEAWFKVSPDPFRPFEVNTQYGIVRALGTAFDINSEEQLTITVYEHAVRISLSNGETVERLTEGSALQFYPSTQAVEYQQDLQKASAWHQQRMVFQARKLKDVINELNRYRKGHITITDKDLYELPLTGVFDTKNPEEALQMIQQTLKLAEYRITDRLVLLYKK